MSKKIIIVGGVAGGASAAARLRRLDENAEIILLERGPYISYANCGLPYYIGEEIKDRSALLLQTPEKMNARFNIDVRVFNEAVKINKDEKIIEIKNLQNGENYKESYDILILSPGSSPLKPPIPGIDLPNIFSLWTVPDTDAIKLYTEQNSLKTAAVIGGGFIGIEMAENLHNLGLDVSIIEMADQIMQPLDFDMAQSLHRHIKSKGVKLYLKDGVKQFEPADNQNKTTNIVLQSGKVINSDIIILAIGIKPNGDLAKGAGLDTNARGGIIVDSSLKTSDPYIYAVGDAIEVTDFVGGNQTMIPLAGPANKQGRMVADNICGKDMKYKGTQGTSIAKVFDMTAASTGLNEKALNKLGKELNKDYRVTLIGPQSHAGYYPGATQMHLKLIFDLEGKVLGCQITGIDGVDKRVDVVATAIRFGASVYDLKELELAYAPPYSSAKDPVNMAGYSAENILKGVTDNILVKELSGIDKENTIILDVRENFERSLGYIPDSLHIPVDTLRKRLNELDKNKLIIPYCAVGIRSYIASRILIQNGFKVKNLAGGYPIYSIYTGDYTSNGSDSTIKPQNESNKTDTITPNNPNTPKTSNANGGSKEMNDKKITKVSETIKVNACGLQCPGPILQVHNNISKISEGDILEISATDPGFCIDVENWCSKTGNTFLNSSKNGKEYTVSIQKGRSGDCTPANAISTTADGTTMVVFSGDLDKALASFIIANGSAAMGKKVTLFFTFWGLNILRKNTKVNVPKNFIEKMFAAMMPRGASNLSLSKMNMGGMGTALMKNVMRNKNVECLESLMKTAMENGVKLVACTMSMDIMGIKEEELIDGVELAGVASYLSEAQDSNVNLFI